MPAVPKRRILVTGATGFIGRNLVERLACRAGLEIHAVAFSRPPVPVAGVTWHRKDLRDAAAVEAVMTGMDLVIHAAAVDQQTTPYELVNVGSGEPVADRDLVRRIVAASGRDLAIEHDLSAPTIPVSLHLDIRRAAERFGWRPTTPLDEGISLTLDWWRRHYGHRPAPPPPANRGVHA